MTLRLIITLEEQVIGFKPDANQPRVIAVQRWSGFSRGRHVLGVNVNDRITAYWPNTPGAVTARYREIAAALRSYAVTETQARDHLERMGQPRERRCLECDTRLPLGWLFCTACGTPRGGHSHRPGTDRPPIFLSAAEQVAR